MGFLVNLTFSDIEGKYVIDNQLGVCSWLQVIKILNILFSKRRVSRGLLYVLGIRSGEYEMQDPKSEDEV